MTATAEIVEVLGGARILEGRVSDSLELGARVRRGLPYASLEAVMDRLHLGREELSTALHLPARTLTRRKKEQRLRPEESDRLARLARVAAHAIEVLGSADRASAWLRRPNRALGGRPPIELLDTDLGTQQVVQVIGRIEHGVVG